MNPRAKAAGAQKCGALGAHLRRPKRPKLTHFQGSQKPKPEPPMPAETPRGSQVPRMKSKGRLWEAYTTLVGAVNPPSPELVSEGEPARERVVSGQVTASPGHPEQAADTEARAASTPPAQHGVYRTICLSSPQHQGINYC